MLCTADCVHSSFNGLSLRRVVKSQPPRQVAAISDVESSHFDRNRKKSLEPSDAKPETSRLTLPSTMLAGTGKSAHKVSVGDPSIDEAVEQQQDLLAEFDKVAEELTKILANLEGSTFVKRLKASSRQQQQVAARLARLVGTAFGVADHRKRRGNHQRCDSRRPPIRRVARKSWPRHRVRLSSSRQRDSG